MNNDYERFNFWHLELPKIKQEIKQEIKPELTDVKPELVIEQPVK